MRGRCRALKRKKAGSDSKKQDSKLPVNSLLAILPKGSPLESPNLAAVSIFDAGRACWPKELDHGVAQIEKFASLIYTKGLKGYFRARGDADALDIDITGKSGNIKQWNSYLSI